MGRREMKQVKIYICFAEADNNPIPKYGKGWVDMFEKSLRTMLQETLKKYTVKIHLVDNSREANLKAITENSIILFILSPNFIEGPINIFYFAEYLRKHLSEYAYFKLVKSPVPTSEQPVMLREKVGHNLYHVSKTDGSIYEITDFFGKEAENSFWPNLTDLCHSVSLTPQQSLDQKSKGKVFLAECGYDLMRERNMIKRELERHGFQVLPNKELPTDPERLKKAIQLELEACNVSIHLLGEIYGTPLPGLQISTVDLQNRLAAQHAQFMAKEKGKENFKRLIWISSDQQNAEERQRFFLDHLKQSAEEQYGADLLTSKMEDFKTTVLGQLTQRINDNLNSKNSFPGLHDANSDAQTIYILSDRRDIEACKPMAEWLQQQGFRILWPTSIPKGVNARLLHQEYLNQCDGLIIFFGNVREEWLEAKLQDTLKAPGMGRALPLHNKAIFTDSDQNLDRLKKVRLKNKRHEEALVILNKGRFSPDSLSDFLSKLSLELKH